jgi:hypothetical protein
MTETGTTEDHGNDNLPRYSYKERISLAPVMTSKKDRDNTSKSNADLQYDVHVRLETHSSLATTNAQDDSGSGASSTMAASPFPDDIVELLQKYRALSVNIQVRNLATQSFPTSPFQSLELEEEAQEQAQENNDIINNNLVPLTSPLTGSSGVSVSVRFLRPVLPVNVSYTDTETDAVEQQEQSFLDLLRELVAKRFILAPLATIEKQRLHRYRNTGTGTDTISSSPSTSTTSSHHGVVEMTTILPMEGSPLAAEGLKAFMARSPSSSWSPCGKDFGIFSIADATAWSNLLLGVNVGVDPPNPQYHTLASRSRGLWMTLQSSPSCHASTRVTDDDDDNNNETDACTFQVSRGLHYSVNVPVGVGGVQGHTKQKKQKNNRSIVPLTLSLADLLPGNNKRVRTCPLADATTIDTVRIEDASTSGNTNPITFQPACRSIDDDDKSSNGNGSIRSLIHSLSLLNSETDISLPCLTMTMNNDHHDQVKVASAWTTTRTPTLTPFWHVGLHVLRPNGVANSGTLRSTIRNDHTFCGAEISFRQTIPAVLVPRWQSLEMMLVQSSTLAGRLIPWTELTNRDIVWQTDGTVEMQFRHELSPESSLFVSLDYHAAFLSFENIPGDANRGIELPPIQVSFVSTTCSSSSVQKTNGTGTSMHTGRGSAQLYSQSVLLLTPLPDMSMPFNVLSLTCTLFAFIIGSLINVLVRRGTEHVKYQLDPSSKPKSKLNKLKQKAEKVKARFWKKRTEPDTT